MNHSMKTPIGTLRTVLYVSSMFLVAMSPLVASAQEVEATEKEVEVEVQLQLSDAAVAGRARLVLDDLNMLVINNAFRPYANMIPSQDGHYLAHDRVELQTYDDLGLSYKYIEADYLRKQLSLPSEQGIIITDASPDGEGHKNGFRSGDIVLKVDDEPVDTQYDFVIALAKDRGLARTLKVRRDGDEATMTVRLTESRVEAEKHWIIGVYVDEISTLAKSQLGIDGGVAVTGLTDDGPAHNAGIVEHDIITHINGQLVNSLEELKKVVSGSDGDELALDVIRRSKKINVTVKPIEAPKDAIMRIASLGLAQGIVLDTVMLQPENGQPEVRMWATLANPSDELVTLSLVDAATEAVGPENSTVTDRLDKLEASLKRLEAMLKDKVDSSDR